MSDVSQQTAFLHRQQRVAHSLIYVAALLLLLIFLGLIGYIFFRGMVRVNYYQGGIAALFEKKFPYKDGQWSLLVNHKIRLRKTLISSLENLLDGQEKDWSVLSEQLQTVNRLVLRSEAEAQGLNAQESVTEQKIQYFDSTVALFQELASNEGAYALVSQLPADLPTEIKVVEVAALSLLAPQDLAAKSHSEPLKPRALHKLLNHEKPEADFSVVSSSKGVNSEQLKEFFDLSPKTLLLAPYQKENKEWQMEQKFRYFTRNFYLSFLYEKPLKNGKVGGVSTIIINTLVMVVFTLLLAAPLSVGVAVYLVEYAEQGRLVGIVRRFLEILSGLPSIIFGLFGFIFFVDVLGFGVGLLSGTLTLVIMIAPTIIRTSEEAFKSVPASYREGSYALGAQRFYTVSRVVIPTAAPGVLTGILLGTGRVIGETAAVLFTLGTGYTSLVSDAAKMVAEPQGFLSFLLAPTPSNLAYLLLDYPLLYLDTSMRSLSLHLYWMVINGISLERGFVTAMLLIFFILFINSSANFIMKRWSYKGLGK